MFYKFYSDWAFLDKLKIGLLCAIAEYGGEYHGSVTELYRKTRINPPKRVGKKQLEDVGYALFELECGLYIHRENISEYTTKIYLIKRGKEFKIHEELYKMIKEKHDNGVGWQNVMKLFLFLLCTGLIETDNNSLKYVLEVGSKKTISSSKRVLKDLGCLITKDNWEVDKLPDGEKNFEYKSQYMNCYIPPKYFIKETEEEIKCYEEQFRI